MIPKFDVTSTVRVDYDALGALATVIDGGSLGFNRDHFDLTQTSWAEAGDAVSQEQQWLRGAASAVLRRRLRAAPGDGCDAGSG